jgi:hypothetical protein
MSPTRYAFDEVRTALDNEWGLSLHRGGEKGDGEHDGRWDSAYSKTGFIVGGDLPRRGFGYQRYRSLADVVASWGLGKSILNDRTRRGS